MLNVHESHKHMQCGHNVNVTLLMLVLLLMLILILKLTFAVQLNVNAKTPDAHTPRLVKPNKN